MNLKTISSYVLPESYPDLLQTIKTRLREAQIKAALSVNREMILFCWWLDAGPLSALLSLTTVFHDLRHQFATFAAGQGGL